MSKTDWIQIFSLVSGFFAALAAWWAKRSSKQLQPRPGRKARLEAAADAATTPGRAKNEVSVRDLVLGALDETVHLGGRVSKIERHLEIEE